MNQLRTWSRVGLGLRLSNALPDTTKPGMQNPHWGAPVAIRASWIGSRSLGVPTPSTVVISAPSLTSAIFVMQEMTSLPSTMTLQAPQWPSPQ